MGHWMGVSLGGLMLAVAAGCAATPSLPGEVGARVYQTRSDVAADAIEIQVQNGADTDLTVVSARLTSPYLSEAATYNRLTRIPAGATIDLKATLPAAACDTDPGASAPASVDMVFELAGHRGQATLPATDSLGQLRSIATAACLNERVERLVTIEPPATVSSGRDVLSLMYRLAPTGEPGAVTFAATGPTTLLTPAAANGRPVDAEGIDVRMTPDSGPRAIEVHYVPARCDAHAIAEDKQGTLLPMRVLVGATPGSITLPVDSDLRSQIYRTVARICGLS